MPKRLLCFILLAIVLGACSQQETGQSTTDNIDLEEVETTLHEQNLELKEVDLPASNAFSQKLNEVSPKVYSLEDMTLAIYIFESVDERKEGMEAFEEMNASASLESYKTYTIQNALVFYVEGKKEINSKLGEALNDLK
ncbi:hypothetical protein [Alkalibacillus almallahensis]|uniref:hypothetical protein n=1 Tax=Alkalibacillus almallahensis TaxID=1379154 RepID=UPI00142218EB|nr:hypothetical protein [Alkalibacillus almallahensis]NIK12160.1 hypothetical protein [Alkalibacillus almallahensis]